MMSPALLHGVDACDVERIADMLARHGERFSRRCFTEAERAYCDRHRFAAQHYAVRFAAKEAAFKAVGVGWTGGVQWTDAEVVRTPTGRPELAITGELARQAVIRVQGPPPIGGGVVSPSQDEPPVIAWSLSLTHTRQLAIASVVGLVVGDGTPG